ncbi:hypothetical protein GTW69_24950 [Streptomyces sp. SID7760]|nr:hypothetical protein [Streptomyces sp. SID7760]
MPRLQVLELPEGAGDERPPFVLVIDEVRPGRVASKSKHAPAVAFLDDVAARLGARGVLVFAETVEIPANQVSPEAWNPVQLDEGQGGHVFGGDGTVVPLRCISCGVLRTDWVSSGRLCVSDRSA